MIDILQEGIRLINRYNSFHNKARHYGTDTLLYPAEIHLLNAIGKVEATTTTALAKTLGITKGAVSQTTTKLIKKGLIVKGDQAGYNEVNISLTDKGKTAYKEHRRLHKDMHTEIDAVIKDLDDNTLNQIVRLISAIDNELNRLEDDNDDI